MVRPSIQLTAEVERDGMLLFQDTLFRRREDGSLDDTVFVQLQFVLHIH